MKKCIFIGPSLDSLSIHQGITVYPPAAMGSIFLATQAGHRVIALVDGVFGNVPAVWHKEILFALSQGVVVIGGGSIGAIRASELYRYGMIGLGRAYRLFRHGMTDDDEVALSHLPEEFNFTPLTEPMINVRFTARRLFKAGLLDKEQEVKFITLVKKIYFANRDIARVLGCLKKVLPLATHDRAVKVYGNLRVDVKRQDAQDVLDFVHNGGYKSTNPTQMKWKFPYTCHWRNHFDRLRDEMPSLNERLTNRR